MGRHVTVASACINQWAMDFEGNLLRIVESIEKAKKLGAKLIVYPEMGIPSNGCGDHFHENDTFLHSWEVLAELLRNQDCENIIVCIGMPVMHKNVSYNCQVIFVNRRILLIRPKLMLCDDYNYRETRWFCPWLKSRRLEDFYLPRMISSITNQKIVPIGDALITTPETCIGFEICMELFIPDSSHITQSLDGAEIFCNSSASHHELTKDDYVSNLISSNTKKCGGMYIYSNLRGCDGDRLNYNGCASLCVNGQFVARSQQFSLQEVEVVSATIDLEDIRMFRNSVRNRGLSVAANELYHRIPSDFSISADEYIPASPYIDVFRHTLEEEISLGPACWLWDYLRRSGQGGFFLPLSGGVDSASTACIVYSMCNKVCQAVSKGDVQVLEDVRTIVGDSSYLPVDPKDLCNRLFVTCYMGTENSSAETKQRAAAFAKQIGSYHMSVGIDMAVSAVLGIFTTMTTFMPKFRVHGGSVRENLALQNVQARLRMVISYLFAQLMLWVRGRSGGLLVLGSANVDESLRGYMTKYDCSSADINPIGGICKVDLKKFLKFMRSKFELDTLDDILLAPPSAELEPLRDGTVAQTDEVDMGMTYEELSTFGRLRKQSYCGPYSMFFKLLDKWGDRFTPDEIAIKVKFFFRAYSINRHKMTVLTPCYHAESYSPDDNRYDHRQILYNTKWAWQFQAIDNELKRLKESGRFSSKISSIEKNNGDKRANDQTSDVKDVNKHSNNRQSARDVNNWPQSETRPSPIGSVFNELSSVQGRLGINRVNYFVDPMNVTTESLSDGGKLLAATDDDDAYADYLMWEQIRKRHNLQNDSDKPIKSLHGYV